MYLRQILDSNGHDVRYSQVKYKQSSRVIRLEAHCTSETVEL